MWGAIRTSSIADRGGESVAIPVIRFPKAAMKKRTLLVFALGAVLLGTTGCATRVSYSATATVAPTRLVAVGPGVWTVYDYHQPVFYADGYYWLWSGGMWYRSTYVDYGFSRVHVSRVPPVVLRIDRPSAYVRYRGTGAVREVPSAHVRRTYRPAPDRRPPPRQEPHRPPPSRGREAPPPARHQPPPARGREAPPPARHEAPPPNRGRGTQAAPPPGRGAAETSPGRGRGTQAAPPPGRSSAAPASRGSSSTRSSAPPARGSAASPSRGGGSSGGRSAPARR